MDYQRIYNQLIERAVTRGTVDGYKERHHIIPKCLGGSNERSNLVELTAEEHYLAHQLLVKVYPQERGLVTAAYIMCSGKGRTNNKMYGWLRREYSKVCSERMKGNKHCVGYKPSDETRAKLRKARANMSPYSDETRRKISDALKGNQHTLGFKHTDESRLNMSEAMKGKKRTPEQCAAMSRRRKGTNVGSSNPAAKTFELVSPSGDVYKIVGGLQKFTQERGLGYDGMKSSAKDGGRILTRGKSKGWSCKEI